MGRLVLVRHGQASFDQPEYDRLSPTGEAQARRLGTFWAGIGLKIDAVETGPSERHRRTAAVVGEAYSGAGRVWPEAVVRESWNEHAVDLVLRDPARLSGAVAVEPKVASFAEA